MFTTHYRYHRSVQLECSRRTTRQCHTRGRKSCGGDAHSRRSRRGSRHVRALLDGAGRPRRAGHRQAQPRCDLLPRRPPLLRCIHVHADPTARAPAFAAAVALAVSTVAASTSPASAVTAPALRASSASNHAASIASFLVVLQRLHLRRGWRL